MKPKTSRGGKRPGAGRPEGTPNPNAGRPKNENTAKNISLPPQAWKKLDDLAEAWGVNRSQAVQKMVMGKRMPKP